MIAALKGQVVDHHMSGFLRRVRVLRIELACIFRTLLALKRPEKFSPGQQRLLDLGGVGEESLRDEIERGDFSFSVKLHYAVHRPNMAEYLAIVVDGPADQVKTTMAEACKGAFLALVHTLD